MGFDFSIRIQQFIWLDERSLVSEKTIILFYLKPDILQKSNRQVKAYGRNVWFETSFCYSFWSTQICELCRINKPRQYKYVSEIPNVIFSWWQFLTYTSNNISFLFSLCLSLFLWTENRIFYIHGYANVVFFCISSKYGFQHDANNLWCWDVSEPFRLPSCSFGVNVRFCGCWNWIIQLIHDITRLMHFEAYPHIC